MKLWGSVRSQAGKLAFEADKMVRIRREEGAIGEANAEIVKNQTELGKAVLGLINTGAISHPALDPFVQAIAQLQMKIAQLEQNVAAIKAEQYVEGMPATPNMPGAPAMPPSYQPVTPVAPVAPAPAATVPCANCGAQISPTAAFCPECGQRVERS